MQNMGSIDNDLDTHINNILSTVKPIGRNDGICQCCKCRKNREKVEPNSKRRKITDTVSVAPVVDPEVLEIANADFPSFDVAHIAIAKRVRDQGYKVVKGNFLRTDRYTGRTFWCCGKDFTGKRCAYTVTFRLHEDSEGYRLSDHDSLHKSHTCVTGTFPREECDKYIVQMIQKYNLYPIATHGGSFASIVQSEEEAKLRVPVPPLSNPSGIIRSNISIAEADSSSSPRPLSPSSPNRFESNSVDDFDKEDPTNPSSIDNSNYPTSDTINPASSHFFPTPHAGQSLGNNQGHQLGPVTCSVGHPMRDKPAVARDLDAAGLLLDFFFHSTQSGGGGGSSSSSVPSASNDHSERHDGNGDEESNQPPSAESGIAESKDP